MKFSVADSVNFFTYKTTLKTLNSVGVGAEENATFAVPDTQRLRSELISGRLYATNTQQYFVLE